jgi:hypothetical protein
MGIIRLIERSLLVPKILVKVLAINGKFLCCPGGWSYYSSLVHPGLWCRKITYDEAMCLVGVDSGPSRSRRRANEDGHAR